MPDLSKMGSADIKSNLLSYIDSFSPDAREIFEHFKFAEFFAQFQNATAVQGRSKVALTEPGIIRTINDPTAGIGGFLSSGMEYDYELNPAAVMRAFGQELNPVS